MRGFDAHKKGKGRKRHILDGTLDIRIVADAGHESRKFARRLSQRYKFRVSTSEMMIDRAAVRYRLNRIAAT